MVKPAYDPDDDARTRAEAVLRKHENALWREAEKGEAAQESLSFKIAGQEARLRTSSLNTVATVATLMIVTGIAVAMYMQSVSAREAKEDFRAITRDVVAALKDMTVATREQNCMLAFPPERREANVELCKRMAR